MNNKLLRIAALVVLVVVVLGMIYGRRILGWRNQRDDRGTAQVSAGERKVLYYYDAMNPQHHYDKPGKAPDGMDLVPQYADDSATRNNAVQSSTQSATPGDRKVLFWYDPMHPAYKSDKPGIAPDCGMQLVPKYADEQTSMAKMPAGTVSISPDKQQLIGVRTGKVERRSLERTIHTTAQLTADETKITHIHVKVSGWIDKVYVDYVGQLVKKGQPLFTLYSPDLVATQEEYLIAKRGQAALGSSPFQEVSDGSNSLFRAARDRLKLWDISDEQIKKLDETGEVTKNLIFYSPTTGFVTDRKAFPQTSVTSDTELYTISDLSTIWANLDVYEYEVPYIHVGQDVELQLSYYPGRKWHGHVSYIYPMVDAQSRTLKVRVQLPNPEMELKPQMFADAQLKVDYGSKVVVPAEAVLDSGNEQVVFVVRDGGMFEPRRITMGPQFDNLIVVLSGLKPGEQIVVSGNFLIDSESRLKSAMGGMQH
ncbi:MAG TPA: efflux RND transporter periplasmic adaptor subunit [Terriglobales bacterium]|jgi:Cu(I)/Ag(I) efflux system membrane fusion protein